MLPEGEEMPRWKKNAGSTPPRLGEEVEDPGKSLPPTSKNISLPLCGDTRLDWHSPGSIFSTTLYLGWDRWKFSQFP